MTDEHLAHVWAQSDRAFQEMQARADRAHAEFLNKYSGPRNIGSSSTMTSSQLRPVRSTGAPLGPPPQTVPQPQQTPAPQQAPTPQQAPKPQDSPILQNPNLNPADTLFPDPEASAAEFLKSQTGVDLNSVTQAQLTDSVDDLKDDFTKLSSGLKDESRVVAQQALRGTSDIIKGSASNLGQRAKEEAAALREAAKQAMQEERNLKAMKGRAAEEARKAKARLQGHAVEAKEEMVEGLQELAQDKLSFFKTKAQEAVETGKEAIKRELGDLASGQDS